MDIAKVEHYLRKYPDLEKFIGAGTISMKAAREILDIDRLLMAEIFRNLLLAGAVRGCGSSTFRATEDLKRLLEQRRK